MRSRVGGIDDSKAFWLEMAKGKKYTLRDQASFLTDGSPYNVLTGIGQNI
ncbi:hypothetical protein SH449x_003474 [Pirellulaceae bacterium SH449]